VAFSPDGRRIATVEFPDQKLRLWDPESGEPVATLRGHVPVGFSWAFSPDGRRIATIDGPEVPLWDAATGEPLTVLKGHTGSVQSLAFSRDGARILTASGDGTSRLWDAASGRQLTVMKGRLGGAMRFSPDGARIVVGGQLWDAETGKPLVALEGRLDLAFVEADGADAYRLVTHARDGPSLWIVRARPEDVEKRHRLWREQQAIAAEKAGHWFGAAFHLSLLIDAEPADASLFARRCKAYALLGRWSQAAADLLQGTALCQPDP
jgi:WD40 repeat protein